MPGAPPPRSPPLDRGAALILLATAVGVGACSEWPRHAHLPAGGDSGALPAGTDPGTVVDVQWNGPTAESESGTTNGLPVGTIAELAVGDGQLFEGRLSGTGWDGDRAPDREGSCGTLAFPVGGGGSYSGDVDWVAVAPQGSGFLCATIDVDDALQFDAVPYRLDDCDEPSAVVADAGGEPFGYDQGGGTARWVLPVDAGDRIGVALGAFWPQDDDTEQPWRIGLSLTTSSLCPTLPEPG